MAKKRLLKGEMLAVEMKGYPNVSVSGDTDAVTALFCWGSTRGVCNEIAGLLGLRVIRPVVLSPFPAEELKQAMTGVTTVDRRGRKCNGTTCGSRGTVRDQSG